MENYLKILEDSLKRKLEILDELTGYSKEQEALLKEETLALGKFDELVDKKDVLIQELTRLDTGFETLYSNVGEQLKQNRAAYKPQIQRMQQMITRITEKSVGIQTLEERNKRAVEAYFKKEHEKINSNRRASKAAYDYYKKMNGGNIVNSSIMDQKQ